MLLRVFVGVLLCALLASQSSAQQTLNVRVISTSEDNVGRQLTYALREIVSSNRTYQIVYGNETSIRVRIVTIAPDFGGNQNFTSYSVVLTMYFQNDGTELFLDQYVGNCGNQRLLACARQIAAGVDEAAVSIREVLAR